MQRGDRDPALIAIKRRLDRRQRIVSAEEVLRHPDRDVGRRHVGWGANYRLGFDGGRTGRCAACSCALERIAHLHPPYRALFLVAAEQNALNRDDVVGQAFVGNPVSDLLVAHPNVAGESGLFPWLALPVRSRRPGPAPQMPIKQIAEAQSAWRLKHIRGRHAGPFPKTSIEWKTTPGSLVSLASRHNPAKPDPAAAGLPSQRR